MNSVIRYINTRNRSKKVTTTVKQTNINHINNTSTTATVTKHNINSFKTFIA